MLKRLWARIKVRFLSPPSSKNMLSTIPWYESNILWGSIGIFGAVTLTVVAAMKHDLRWLLLLAWPFGVLAVWVLLSGLHWRRSLVFVGALLCPSIILAGTNIWLTQYSMKEDNSLKEKPIIIVTPNKIEFSSSEWNVERPIEVRNTSTNTVYGIWIKIEAISGKLNSSEIGHVVENIDDSLVLKLGDTRDYITWNYDVMSFYVLENKGQRLYIFLVIYKLEGLKSKFIRIVRKAAYIAKGKNRLKLSLKAVEFKNEAHPPSVVRRNNEIGIQVIPPNSDPIWVVLKASR
jgi:hypothetical protein